MYVSAHTRARGMTEETGIHVWGINVPGSQDMAWAHTQTSILFLLSPHVPRAYWTQISRYMQGILLSNLVWKREFFEIKYPSTESWCLSKVDLKPLQPRRPVGNAHGSWSKSFPWMPGLTGESPWITKPFPTPQTRSGSRRHLLLGMNEFNWISHLNKKWRWFQWNNVSSVLFLFGSRVEGWGRSNTLSISVVLQIWELPGGWGLFKMVIPSPNPRFQFSKLEVIARQLYIFNNPMPQWP